MNEDFVDMIAFVNKIEKLLLTDDMDDDFIPLHALRPDEPREWYGGALLDNAPHMQDGYVVVPKVKGV